VKSFKQHLNEKMKWEQKWYKHMYTNVHSPKPQKIYSYHSPDGRFDITISGDSPTGVHKPNDKRTYWMVWDNENKKPGMATTFTTYKKAMKAVEDRYY